MKTFLDLKQTHVQPHVNHCFSISFKTKTREQVSFLRLKRCVPRISMLLIARSEYQEGSLFNASGAHTPHLVGIPRLEIQ